MEKIQKKNIWWLFSGMYQKQEVSKRHTSLSQKSSWKRAMREYRVGIKHEKSALNNFADKYVI